MSATAVFGEWAGSKGRGTRPLLYSKYSLASLRSICRRKTSILLFGDVKGSDCMQVPLGLHVPVTIHCGILCIIHIQLNQEVAIVQFALSLSVFRRCMLALQFFFCVHMSDRAPPLSTQLQIRKSAIADGPRDALCQSKSFDKDKLSKDWTISNLSIQNTRTYRQIPSQ